MNPIKTLQLSRDETVVLFYAIDVIQLKQLLMIF